MGKWDEGKEYLREAEVLLEMKEEEITDYSAYESLAVVYSEIGDHEKSIEILNSLIKHMRESYGLDDKSSPVLSIPYAHLCSAYYYNGDREEAYKSIESCMDCLDQSQLKSKPDTRILERNEVIMRRPYIPPWAAMHIVTTLLCDFGDITYSMNELIERIASAKFEDTPLLLGRLYRHRGFYPKAEKILEQHLRECDGHKDSIRIGLIWAELGKVYREQGYIIRGVKAFEKAYNIHRQFYGNPNHPEVAFIQAELGRVVQLNGNKELGMEMMKEAVDVCKKHMENEACETKNILVGIKYAQMLSSLAIVLRYARPPEEMNEALQYLEEALALQNCTLDERSIYRIRTLYYIGSVYQKKGDIDSAIEKMSQSLQLIESVDPSHPYKASICTGLGRLLQSIDPDSLQAEKYMKDAFLIRQNPEKFSSEAHWKVAFAYRSVGELMLRKKSEVEAFKYFMDANNMFVRLIERESSEKEEWLDSRSSSAPDYGINIVDRWYDDQASISNEMQSLVKK